MRLLPPRSSPLELVGPELGHLETALRLEGVLNVNEVIFTKMFGRLLLSCGTTASSAMAAGGIKRRNSLLLIDYEDLVCRPSGSFERIPKTMYGLVLHDGVVYIDHPQTFAYLECVTSSVGLLGRYNRPERRRQMDCFSSASCASTLLAMRSRQPWSPWVATTWNLHYYPQSPSRID